MRPQQWRRKKQWRTFKNEQIKAFNIMLVDGKWTQLGLVPRAKALAKAEEQGMDLVQVAYDPVKKVATAKIIDYGKYMYEQKKKENDKKKKQKAQWQKEVKFGYNIGDHDLEIKLKKAREFLEKWYAVKLSVVLRWREKAYKSLVRERFEEIVEKMQDFWRPQWIKVEHFGFTLVLLSRTR